MNRKDLAVALGVCIVAAILLGRVPLLPPGPGTDYTEVGEGSDLDIQLEMAWVGASYGAGSIAWWDPYPDFGQPLIANAEAFVGHPGFLLGVRDGDPQGGVLWMYRVQLLVLLLGASWLAVGLGLPWWTGPPLLLPLLASSEWQERIGVGHLMIIGLSAIPAAIAGWLAALQERTRRRALWVGALGGAAVGLGSLAGGHYPTAFTVFLLLLASWCWVAGPRLSTGLLGLMVVPFVLPGSLAESSPLPMELTVLGVLCAGLWFGRARVVQGAVPLLAFALGMLSVAAWRLVPSFAVVKLNWRAASWRSISVDPLPLSSFFGDGRDRGLEDLLRVSHLGIWLVLLVGIALLASRWARPVNLPSDHDARWPGIAALAVAVGVCVLLGWGAGRPMHPWRVATLAPGMSAINYPVRLQWILLILPGFGWFGLLHRLGGRWSPVPWLPSALGAFLLTWSFGPRAELDAYPSSSPVPFTRADGVEGVLLGGSNETLSKTSLRGWIRPHFATGIGFGLIETPSHSDTTLGHAERPREEGARTPEKSGVSVEVRGRRDEWTVVAPEGTQVRLAQRDLMGWRCQGGEQIVYPEDDALQVATPRRGNNWLRVLVGPDGETTCRWRPPGLGLGVLLQVLAWMGLVACLWPALSDFMRSRRAR